MSLLRYAASGVLRNRRRMLSSILGVLLALTFIAGTFIAIDSSTRASLDATLQGLQGDFSYSALPSDPGPPSSGSLKNGTNLRNALAAVPGVADASVYRQISMSEGGALLLYNPRATANNSFGWQTLTALDPRHLPNFLRDATISGSVQLPNGTAILDSQTAAKLGVKVGDPVGVLSGVWSGGAFANLSLVFTVGAIATFPPLAGYGTLFGFNLRDFDWVVSRLGLTPGPLQPSQIEGEVWIDRARLVNPYDIGGTLFQIARLDRNLTLAMTRAGYGGQVHDNISPALDNIQPMMQSQRIQYLVYSSPVILLGLYLGAVGVDLGHAERRRELAVLKTRGASRWQVAQLLILESLLGGTIASVLGLFLGMALSRLLIGAVTPVGASADVGTVTLAPETVAFVAILGTMFMGIASFRSAKRAADLPIIETLGYHAPGEARIRYSPTRDAAMIGYSVLVYGWYWYVTSYPGSLFIFLIGIPFLLTLPLTPILLILGSIRLMTRSTGRVYEWASRLIRPFARNLEHIVSRNLSRNPRRSSSIAIIIALGLAFGILSVSGLASSQAMQEQSLRASIGADLSAAPPYLANASADVVFGANLGAVSGIAGVTRVLPVYAQVSPRATFDTPYVYAIDPSSYFAVSQPASFYFETPGKEAAAQRLLATDGQVLVTGQFARDAALQVSDPLVLSSTTLPNGSSGSISVTVHVGGIVRFLPGTYNGYFFGSGPNAPEEVYGSYSTLGKLVDAQETSGLGYFGQDRFLAALQPKADWKAAKAEILALGSTNVEVYQELLPQLGDAASSSSFLGFIRTEVAFIVVILTAGLALIIYAASLDRTVEFADIIARGSSGWQTAGLLVGEAFSIILIGVVVGLAVGLVSGYLSVSLTYGGVSVNEPIIPNLFVFPLDGLLLLILAPVAMLGTTVVVAWRIARMNLARALKMRGG